VVEKELPEEEISLESKQADELADVVKPHTKTKHEQDTFPKPDKEGCHLDDPVQVEAIYHYLLIVLDDNNSDKYRYDASKHLATYYFKRPIFSKDWNANEAHIIKEFIETGTNRIQREIPCLFESIDVIEEGQSKKEAVEAVRNKLSIVMLIDVLGEGWRNEPREAEIMGLGIGEGRDVTTTDIILTEAFGDNDPLRFTPQSTTGVTEGRTEPRLNLTPCYIEDSPDKGEVEASTGMDGPLDEHSQRFGEGEEPEEEFGLGGDEVTGKEWRKPGIAYHHGITDFTGKPSEEWADCIMLGQQRKALSELEPGICLEQIMDKSNLSESERDVIEAIANGVSQIEYAKLHNIRPETVRKRKQRAQEEMIKAREKLERDSE